MPAATHETLVGLLAVTGMRVGEAIRLDRADIDWAYGVLAIRESKFGKSRMVPVRPSTLAALIATPGSVINSARRPPRRASSSPRPAPACSMRRAGRSSGGCATSAGVGADAARPPRIHDLRHTFAVRTLLGWYQAAERRRSPAAGPVDLPGSS